MQRLVLFTAAMLLTVLTARTASAAGNAETSVIPGGNYAVEKGWHDVHFPIAQGADGPLPMGFVLIAARPYVEATAPIVFEDEKNPFAPPVVNPQVSGVIKFKIGDRALADWTLEPGPNAYLISWESVRNNSTFKNAMLSMSISLESEATAVRITLLSMPEFVRLLKDDAAKFDGPLTALVESLKDESLTSYFGALSREISGDISAAKAGYAALFKSPNVELARFARRGFRMISYQERAHKLSGNIMEHRRWGLFCQFGGFYAPAFNEFEEVRIIDPQQADSQFRGGECLERIGGDTLGVIQYFNRTGEATPVADPMHWNILVTLVKSRGNKTLSDDEIIVIKDSFVILERTLWAASHGAIRLGASFYEIDQEETGKVTKHLNRVTGPPDDLISERGWYDSVFYIRPRISGETSTTLQVAGNEVGPNGSAIAAFFHDAPFSVYMNAIYSNMYFAAQSAGQSAGWPLPDAAGLCGLQPARFVTSGLRSAMRYHISRADFERIKGCDEIVADSFLQLWKLEGPIMAPSEQVPSPLTLEWPTQAAAAKTIVSNDDFINLREQYPDATNAKVRATCWVYIPTQQSACIRLGRNDSAALALNGRPIFSTPSLAGSKFEGRNLVDTAFSRETLEAGWNEIQVVVASRSSEKNKDFGFSVSITTLADKPVPGMACINVPPPDQIAPRYAPPEVGEYYNWADVGNDFHRSLPCLKAADLRKITGVNDLEIRQVRGQATYVAIDSPSQTSDSGYRNPTEMGGQSAGDFALNNILDLSREALAAFRYNAANEVHDLLVVRPEALDAVCLLLNEPESASALFKKKPPSERLMGWLDAGDCGTLFVIDARLTDNSPWPVDEEDLLSPVGPFVPNWPDEFREGPPLPDSPQSPLYQLPN